MVNFEPGTLSLLIYFPIESPRSLSSSTADLNSSISSHLSTFDSDSESICTNDDALLAKALAEMEDESGEENIYAKPRGKSYRKCKPIDNNENSDDDMNVHAEPDNRDSENDVDNTELGELLVKIDLNKIKLRTVKNKDKNDVTDVKSDFDNIDPMIDEYSRRLDHVGSCQTKTLQLAEYSEFDRSITPRSDPSYFRKLLSFVKKNRSFPTNDGSIKLGIDKINGTAVVLDGNHRLTCATKLESLSYPEYVKFKCQYGHFPDGKKLPFTPDPYNWPTFICGCDLGFTTAYSVFFPS